MTLCYRHMHRAVSSFLVVVVHSQDHFTIAAVCGGGGGGGEACRGGGRRGERVGVGVCTDPVRLLAAGIKYGSGRCMP